MFFFDAASFLTYWTNPTVALFLSCWCYSCLSVCLQFWTEKGSDEDWWDQFQGSKVSEKYLQAESTKTSKILWHEIFVPNTGVLLFIFSPLKGKKLVRTKTCQKFHCSIFLLQIMSQNSYVKIHSMETSRLLLAWGYFNLSEFSEDFRIS